VIVGTAAAERFIAWRGLCALIVSLSLQVAVNYANDLFDAQRGVDTEARVGPRRVVSAGLVSPRSMSLAVGVATAVASLTGLALAAAAGWELLVVGLAAVAAALAYSGGPRPYASAGLGEVMVFLFFGVVATVGSSYVQDETLRMLPFTCALPVGLLAAAILVANNLRDITTDSAAGKRTLAVRLGRGRTIVLFRSLIAVAFMCLFLIAVVAASPWPLIALGTVGLAAAPLRDVTSESAPVLIGALAATARLQLTFGVALAIGLWL
jgi:1,4-dihydroxy-2-naphthoate octaprenyltransferase